MRLSIILIFALLLLSGVSGAVVNVPFSNSTSLWDGAKIIYNSPSENVFDLDNNDTLVKHSVDINIKTFPYIERYVFVDSFNNILNIEYTTTKQLEWYGLTEYTTTKKVYYNTVLMNIYDTSQGGKIDLEPIGTSVFTQFREISLSGDQDFDYKVGFSANGVYLYKSGFLGFKFHFVELPVNVVFYPNVINNPINDASFNIIQMTLDYTTVGSAITQIRLNEGYAGLNFVFKFAFLVLKGFLYLVPSFIISDADYMDYQLSIQAPLSTLDMLLDIFLGGLGFLFTMGITFTFLLVECLIFIFCYLKTGGSDIIETLHSWIRNSANFWTAVLIRPATWFFEKIVKIWA